MTRDEFLSQKWQRYPVVPPGALFLGRLQELQRFSNNWQVTLVREAVPSLQNFLQLYLQEAPEAELPQVLRAGDLLAISEAGAITLLAPHLKKLPERPLHLETLKLWQDFTYWVREFFKEQGFVEIQTPGLVKCPGTEPSLDVFQTDFVRGSHREKLYLPTSPELHLKKALALGAERIFEIKKCYRNGEVTEHHQPEFTMIEWYRAYAPLSRIQKDVAELVQYLVQKMPSLKGPAGIESASLTELFHHHCGFAFTAETSQQDLQREAQRLGVDVRAATSIDDCFFLLFLEKIESELPRENLVFVTKYPPYQAALARLTREGWGDRFEVYWQGFEIANAFHELNDPEVQKKRFQEDLAKKKLLQKEVLPLDDEFMQCLEAGMPPSSGIALGLERLFMALTNLSQISDTRLFPIQD